MATVDYFVAPELRRFLVTEGIVRKPSVSSALPLCVVNHPQGPPQANAENPVVVHLLETTGFAKGPLEDWIEYPVIDITIRALPDAASTVLAWQTARALTRALDDSRAWQMGNINIDYSRVWRAFGMFPDGQGDLGIRLLGSFELQVRTSQLTQTV